MSRLLRIFVHAATVVSLTLCLATAAFWVRNRNSSEEWVWCDPKPPTTWPCPRIPVSGPAPTTTAAWSFRALTVSRGRVWFLHGRYITFDSPPRSPYFLPPSAGLHWRRPGPLADHSVRGSSGFITTTFGLSALDAQFQESVGGWPGASYHAGINGFAVAMGWAILLTAVLPSYRLATIVRRCRPRLGHCLSCGYDLRATPDRCPECGAVPKNAERKSNWPITPRRTC
ncbi:MAG: hypothetical protein JWN40_3292 [Phycisphaerales bacterium]|nr:hypothetical protein [Phycisphaerales bacterium]